MKKLKKTMALLMVVAMLLTGRPALANDADFLWQIGIIVVNVVGFALSLTYGTEGGDEIESAVEDAADVNESTLQGITEAMTEQNIFEALDDDDWEQHDSLEFFTQTTSDAMQLAYYHYIASAMGTMGTMKNGEMLSQSLYGSPLYEFHRQIMASHFVLRSDELSQAIKYTELNLCAPDMAPAACAQLQESAPVPGSEEQSLFFLKNLKNKVDQTLSGDAHQEMSRQEIAQASAFLGTLQGKLRAVEHQE